MWDPEQREWPLLVIVGGGFGGIELVKSLPKKGLRILLIDRFNYHTFQPLLYQVATGGLEAGSIAYPLRRILKCRKNARFRMGEVFYAEPEANVIHTSFGSVKYDYLVLATGSTTNFFGNAGAAQYALPLKSVPNAVDMRGAVLQSLELAVATPDPDERRSLCMFVVAGGGATGVEVAGALSELRRVVIPADYPELSREDFKIVLVEGGERLLPSLSEYASEAALQYLTQMGVQVRLNALVEHFDGRQAAITNALPIRCRTLIWAAGVKGSLVPGFQPSVVAAKPGRIRVNSSNRVLGSSNVFAIGDVALMELPQFPHGHPMLAPVAKQQGRLLGKNIGRLLSGMPFLPFQYRDRGALATVGRSKAVGDFGRLHLRGFIAWLVWSFVHIAYLVGFRNKLLTFLDWSWNFFTYERLVRLIVRPSPVFRPKAPEDTHRDTDRPVVM